MTTIIFDHKNKQIACDSRVCAGNRIETDSDNKFLKNNKGLWFLAGPCFDSEIITTFSSGEIVEKSNKAVAILAAIDGSVYDISVHDGMCLWEKIDYSISKGSGSDFALALIDMGKTAKEAVEYAMTRDIYTGGKVNVYDIEKGEFI